MPAALVPLLAAGTSIFNNMLNAGSTRRANRENRQFQEYMYDKSRKDALSDWEMQNAYNSPKAEMQRLRDANLNPNLVYGTGTVGSPAGVPRSPQVEQYRAEPIRHDLSGVSAGLMSYYDIQLKEAQTDNVQMATTVQAIDGALKTAQKASVEAGTEKTGVETAQSRFNLDLAQSLRQNSLEVAQASLKKLQGETAFTLSNMETQKALAQSSIQKAVVEVLKMRADISTSAVQRRMLEAQIKGALSDNELKHLDAEMARAGITKDSPWWLKTIEQALQQNGIGKYRDSQTLEDVMRMKLNNPGHGPKTPYYKKVLPQ